MNLRFPVLAALFGASSAACGVERLPAATAPTRVMPADLDVPLDAPASGTGRVILETNGEPAKVVEITGSATATSGAYTSAIVGLRPLCTTPCVLDLPYGSHPLVMQSIADETRQSEAELDVGARPKVFRHTLGERKDGGAARTVGGSLLTLGILAAATGAIVWAVSASGTSGPRLAESGLLLTAFGAGGIALSIPFLVVGRPTERPGSTTQWTLPGASPPPPPAPRGVTLDRL